MTTPSRFEIARYWLLSADINLRRCIKACDIQEPCCFACGYYAESWDDRRGEKLWNRATLEKAHLVPRALGGKDSVENLVLLCATCHESAPDYIDPTEMLRWMLNRKTWDEERAINLLAACESSGVTPQELEEFFDQPWNQQEEILRQAAKNISSHLSTAAKGLKPSSFALVMRDAIQIDLDTF